MENINKLIYPIAVALCLGQGLSAQTADEVSADSVSKKVNVAFRSTDASQVLGGISTVNMREIDAKSYTDYSLSNMDAMVAGINGGNWGNGDALVLIDGVPRDANNVLPNEIESITYLKGAQAVVLYGSTAAKGVILITTKRGQEGDLRITVRGNAGLYAPKSYPKYLGSAEYMTYYNQARVNDGLNTPEKPFFSDVDIYNYGSGVNPYRYPNVNFFSEEYLKKSYWRYEGQAEFTGGGKYATYYAGIGLYHSDDLMNFGEGKNNGVTRLNVRGNIDLRLNDVVSGWVNTSATFYDSRSDLSGFWGSSASMRPMTPGSSSLAPLIPIDYLEATDVNSWAMVKNSVFLIDGKYLLGGTQNAQTNPFAGMYAAGYSKFTSRQLQFDAGIRLDLSKITPGLSFRTMAAVDYATTYNTSINNSYATYEPVWTNYAGVDLIGSLNKYGNDVRTGNQNISGSSARQTILWSGQFDYARQFESDHNVEANLIAYGYQRSYTGQYFRNCNATLALRAAYDYQRRYFAEFNGALIHSAKLAPGHRNGFSPVGTLGWRISQEEFLQDVENLDELKLSVTGGLINQDLDIENFYLWSDIFTSQGDWYGWSDGFNGYQAASSRRGGNPELTFIKRKEFNVGIDGSLFNQGLRFNGNFFVINTDGKLTQPSNILPNYFKSYYPNSDFLPWMNYNNSRRVGFDLGVVGTQKFGDLKLSLGLNAMYSESKNTRINENVEYDWLRAEGANSAAMRGYKCLGFFNSQEEIDAARDNRTAGQASLINSNTKPGDLKYADQNGDGVIDDKDNVIIGRWDQPWAFGFNFTAEYKNFSLWVVGNAYVGGNYLMNNNWAWVYGDRKYSTIVRGAWTEEKYLAGEEITYPRLTTQGGELNFVTSDFWMGKADVFNLSQVQLTYTFPGELFQNKFVRGLQLYANGNNLITARHNRSYHETNVGSAPQCRVFNFGAKINF